MKTLVIKSSTYLLLGLWFLLHMPFNLIHHHDEVCGNEQHHKTSNDFHLHELEEDFCFFCANIFAKELGLSSSSIEFSSIFYKSYNVNLISIVFKIFVGLSTERAPPFHLYF